MSSILAVPEGDVGYDASIERLPTPAGINAHDLAWLTPGTRRVLPLGAGKLFQQETKVLYVAVVVAGVVLPTMHKDDQAEILRRALSPQPIE